MVRINYILLVLMLLVLPVCLAAQYEDDEAVKKNTPAKTPTTLPPYSLKDHLVYGGNFGLNFGNVTSISVSPMIGYKVTDKFTPGIGLTYNYLRFNYQGYRSDPIHIYGGSIWARYYILENIFLHGEYEALNAEWDPYVHPGYRYNLNSALIGGGYRQSFGNLASYVLVLYNVTYTEDSPYPSPLIIRVGFGFGM
ncbi:hypothetical protein BH11BAC7_BH11BAC7_23150 [soil metagenome]